jgi:hypothetical protein
MIFDEAQLEELKNHRPVNTNAISFQLSEDKLQVEILVYHYPMPAIGRYFLITTMIHCTMTWTNPFYELSNYLWVAPHIFVLVEVDNWVFGLHF